MLVWLSNAGRDGDSVVEAAGTGHWPAGPGHNTSDWD